MKIEDYRAKMLPYYEEYMEEIHKSMKMKNFNELESHVSKIIRTWGKTKLNSKNKDTLWGEVDECFNEICFIHYLINNCNVKLTYEPKDGQSYKSIDIKAENDFEEIAYYDIKTVHPIKKDKWEEYKNGKYNNGITLDKEMGGGELYHYMIASRRKFYQYSLELEEKIQGIKRIQEKKYKFYLVLCDYNGIWEIDKLEDFVEYYKKLHYGAGHGFFSADRYH